MERKHYDGLDGLRTLAMLGIVLMHVQSNSTYRLTGYLPEVIIPSFTNFVFLFMTVSAFSMCCGYYEKILNGKISISEFYKKRFQKVLPFFAVLVLLDLIAAPSVHALYEGFADLTLMFGFLPNAGNLSVIGVGWFLGLIFVFYLCFPFFCVLLENRKKAWFFFAASLFYNYVCRTYFLTGRNNILYSACYFLSGGLIFLYRKEIEQWSRMGSIILMAATVLLYYTAGHTMLTSLLVCSSLLICGILSRGSILGNPVMKFFSSISLEIYLSHMALFRVIEKLRLNTLLGNGWVQYLATSILVLISTTIFSLIVKKIISVVSHINRNPNKYRR